MTATDTDDDLRLRLVVEDFLTHEAHLLDTWQLYDWLALFTADGSYLVPSTDRPEGDPLVDLFLVQDDRFLLEQRVESLMTGSAWAENPHSTTRHLVTNVTATRSEDGRTVIAHANFLVTRARRATVDLYPGRYRTTLITDDPLGFGPLCLRIAEKKAILSLEALRPHGRVSVIL